MAVALALVMAASLWIGAAYADTEPEDVNYAVLLSDMVKACENPSQETIGTIDGDVAALDDPFATAIAERWKQVYLDQDYDLLLYGKDDPKRIPVHGKHVFVVMGYKLKDGGMTDELRGRCAAAAAAAQTFPDSLVICTGGATGENNHMGRTEGGLMRDYLIDTWGLAPDRILTEEKARTTLDNVNNVMPILEDQQVESATIITSDYHQRRCQVLFVAVAARYRQEKGYAPDVVGNYSFAAGGDHEPDYETAIRQLLGVVKLPYEQSKQFYSRIAAH